MLLVSTLTVMSGAIIAPALPGLAQNLNTSPLLSKLILTVPALMIALSAPFVGALSDRFGRIKLLIICLLVYGSFGTVAFLIDNIYLLLASRAVFGIGVAGIFTISISLVSDYYYGEEKNRLMGMQASFMALGGVVFLMLAGFLADFSWRSPFLLYLLGFAFLPLTIVHLPNPQNRSSVLNEPLISASIKKEILLIYLLGFLGMIFFYIIPTQIPFLITHELELSNTHSGLAVALATSAAATASFIYSSIKKRASYTQIYGLSFLLFGAGFLIINMVAGYLGILAGLLVSGFGAGFLFPNGALWLSELNPENIRGKVNGGFSTAVFTGQFFSPLALSPLLLHFDLREALLLSSLFIGCCSLIMFLAPRIKI